MWGVQNPRTKPHLVGAVDQLLGDAAAHADVDVGADLGAAGAELVLRFTNSV